MSSDNLSRTAVATLTAAGPTAPPPTTTPTREGGRRDRYLDVLRFAAIARVIVYHTFGFVWLTYVFPAMGVMFALGGSLMANSLAKPDGRPVRKRIRRLLPALWVFGAVVVPVMVVQAIREGDIRELPGFDGLLTWVFPIVEPPGTAWAEPATVVLWYLVTYLWLVMLSPLAIRAYRRWPLPTVLAPLAALIVIGFSGLTLDSAAGAVVLDLATYGSCWLIGFAHRDGRLAGVRLRVLIGVAALTMIAGGLWAVTHPTETGLDLNNIPLAQGLYSFGFVLLAMRVRPSLAWLRRVRVLDWLVTAANARAVTIYLWHNPAIGVSYPIGDWLDVWRFGERNGGVLCLVIAVILTAVSTIVFGWIEDIAAGRKPRLIPR
ncbi:MAG: acyltransferase [Micromonosporaceae bacterium]|nr:acyltransferase [Micromonosporaceae bacterium]